MVLVLELVGESGFFLCVQGDSLAFRGINQENAEFQNGMGGKDLKSHPIPALPRARTPLIIPDSSGLLPKIWHLAFQRISAPCALPKPPAQNSAPSFSGLFQD